MRGRELTKSSAAAPTDLLVCFPTRAHLTAFLPKPACSPARLKLPEPSRHVRNSLPRRGMKKSGSITARRGQTSPALRTKITKQMGTGPIVSEPTSPKVTCAGQIKVKPRIGGGRSWQSVMEEIEKIHSNGKSKSQRPAGRSRESSWGSSFINKEVMQFLTCLRNVRLKFRCFGAFPAAGTISDDEEEDGEDGPEEEEEEDEEEEEEWEENSKAAVFSKWFTVLQEAKETKTNPQPETGKKRRGNSSWDDSAFAAADAAAPLPPPPNALLLMRCRSAPAKTVVEERKDEQFAFSKKAEDGKLRSPDDGKKKLRLLIDEEKKEEEEERKKQQGMFMETYDTTGRHCIFSAEIAKETWVLEGTRDTLPRSWSSKS